MSRKRLKYIFIVLSALLLAVMVLVSRDAGITCDEVLHYNQSVAVYNFFASHGTNTAALNTPVTHLQYYGQSYDNFVTILSKWLNIDDVYGFRHLMSTLAGWLAIVITALLAIWFAGYEAGLIVLVLFAISPTFLGHAQNNLKDIPFALAYVSGTYFTFRFLNSGPRISLIDSILLTLSIAFCISIRAGGLIMICYLFLFFIIFYSVKFITEGKTIIREFIRKLSIVILLTVAAYFLSVVLWPYALKDPLRVPLESYRVMAHFPDTFRQVFEGKTEWSDYMPWYYLPKYMAITIPVLVLAALLCFMLFFRRISKAGKTIYFWLLIFTIVFPVAFVIYEKSNLYSGWRHFLFVYPGIIVLSSVGVVFLLRRFDNKIFKGIVISLMVLLAAGPLLFMIRQHRYSYLYFNELAGGYRKAYFNYENDYYFVNHREASEWLTEYLKKKGNTGTVIVAANFSVEWLFRKTPGVKTVYFRNEERSMVDWDYAIMTNRYIPVSQVKSGIWPPRDAIKLINVEGRTISAIIERKSKDSFYGWKALSERKTKEAIGYFESAIEKDDRDEMIFYNFAVALYRDGQKERADTMLKKSLELNPDFEPALMFLGNIAAFNGEKEKAEWYYQSLISKNRKYFEAYLELSKLLVNEDVVKARTLLLKCLEINSKYKPAVIALADTYRNTDPEVAKKYDEIANKLK